MKRALSSLCLLFCLEGLLCLQAQNKQYVTFYGERPKVGVAFGGGGAKGIAHLGVLQVFEEYDIPIDYIAGTSIGAIVGGLYAAGYNSQTLIEYFKTIDVESIFQDQPLRKQFVMEARPYSERYLVTLPIKDKLPSLPDGMINGQSFVMLLDRLLIPVKEIQNFDELRIPFRSIATDMSTGEAYVFKSGNLSTAIRASMSVPTIFKPVDHDGTKLLDGGIVRNLPAEDVIKMGAELVISVDLGKEYTPVEEMNSIFKVFDRAISFQISTNTERQIELSDVVLKPELSNYSMASFNQIDSLVGVGRQAALEALPNILKLLNRSLEKPEPKEIPSLGVFRDSDFFLIRDVEYRGVQSVSKSIIEYFLAIEVDNYMTIENLEERINTLYSSQMFEQISYSLVKYENGFKLIFDLKEGNRNDFRVGMRYGDIYKAGFLFNVSTTKFEGTPSVFNADVKIGEEYMANISYRKVKLVQPRFSFALRSQYRRTYFPEFKDRTRIAELRLSTAMIMGSWSTILAQNLSFSFFGKQELYNTVASVGVSSFDPSTILYHSFGANVLYDSYNSNYFPSSGVYVKVFSEVADELFFSARSFSQYVGTLSFATEIADRLVLKPKLFVGASAGAQLPQHQRFMAGGAYPSLLFEFREQPFWGVQDRSFSERNMSIAQVALQYEWIPKNYISAGYNLIAFTDSWSWNYDEHKSFQGMMVSYGMESPFGPLQLAFMRSSLQRLVITLSLGHYF